MCVGVSVWLGWSGIRVACWSLAILFHCLCAQHVSDINISIIRSLRLFCWITTMVALFLVRCVLEFRCGWVGVLSVLQAEELLFYFTSYMLNMFRTLIYPLRLFCWVTTLVVLFLVRCVLEFRCGWVGVISVLQAEATNPTQPHRYSNTHRTKNNTTNVVIQQNSHKLLMMDILMSETCWAHKKWNKIASGIKLVFYSSTNSALLTNELYSSVITKPVYNDTHITSMAL